VQRKKTSLGGVLRMDDGADDYFNVEGGSGVEEVPPKRLSLRGRFLRSNSTSTVKITTTMSHPNNDATIEVIARRLYAMIKAGDQYHAESKGKRRRKNLDEFNDLAFTAPVEWDDSDTEDLDSEIDLTERENKEEKSDDSKQRGEVHRRRPSCDKENEIGLVNDKLKQKQKEKSRGVALQEVRGESQYKARLINGRLRHRRNKNREARFLPRPPVVKPTVDTIQEFLKNMFITAQCSEECNIICLLYVEKLLKCTGTTKALNSANWKAIVMTSLLLASKVWDDLSMVNEDFSIFMPYSLEQINDWEIKFLARLEFSVRVPASLYADRYFELRAQAHREGIEAFPDKETTVEDASRLEMLTSVWEKRTKEMLNYKNSVQTSPADATTTTETPTLSISDLNSRWSSGKTDATILSTETRDSTFATASSPQLQLRRCFSDSGPKSSPLSRFIID